MAALKNHQTAGRGFGNSLEWRRVTWDFAKDGGGTGALDILTADSAIIIAHAHLKVLTACTSGGSATLIWGVSGGDTDIFCNATQGAVANLTANAIILPPVVEGTPNVLPNPMTLAASGKLIMTIATAAMTAGKIEFAVAFYTP